MKAQSLFNIYLAILPVSVLIGIYRYRQLDNVAKWICFLLLSACISEYCIKSVEHNYQQRNVVYHVYSIVEIIMISAVFLSTVKYKTDLLKKILVAVFWVLIGIGNCVYFQPLHNFNSNILMLESFTVIAMAITVLYRIFKNEAIRNASHHAHFWFWSLFLMLWTSTFFLFPFVIMLYKNKWPYLNAVECVQAVINIIVYGGIGIIFFMYPKLSTSEN